MRRGSGETNLLQQLRDQDAVVRRQAARALGRVGRRESARQLCLVLGEDPSGPVRRAAAEALGRIGEPSARATLERASKHDEDGAVRSAAAAALLRLTGGSGETPAILPTSKE